MNIEKMDVDVTVPDAAPKLLPCVAKAVKLSQELPTANTPAFIYYNDFPQYKAIAAGQSRKILKVLQKILDYLDAKSNVLDITNAKNSREKFASIVDANDKILERLSISMDLEEDPSRKNPTNFSENLVVAVQTKRNSTFPLLKTPSSFNDVVTSDESDGLLKLLTSTSVRRPQALFSRQPDNSTSYFRPTLVKKPNQLVPLSECIPADLKEDEECPHPYLAELEEFSNRIPNWRPIALHNRTGSEMGTNYQFVADPDLLSQMILDISSFNEIAVDLEHHSHRTYLGITCLIQLSTRDMDYVIDALALRDHLTCLNEVFTNPDIVKIFHGCNSDLMWLQRDFSVYVVNLFDTGLAARALQLGRFSLGYLLQRYVGVRTNKKYQLADWRIRPLPEELIKYARTDTHYLIEIAGRMCQELSDRGLLQTVLEQSRQLCLRRYTKPLFNPLGYLKIYQQAAGTTFSHRQLYALEQLHSLRDSIARREDESVHYVLPNHMLKVISEVLPRESSGLFACCNPIPPLVRKYVHDLHKIVLDARNRPISELPVTTDPESVGLVDFSVDETSRADESGTDARQSLITAPPHDHSHEHLSTGATADLSCRKSSASRLGYLLSVDGECTNMGTPKRSDADRRLLLEFSRLISFESFKSINPSPAVPEGYSTSQSAQVAAVINFKEAEQMIRLADPDDTFAPKNNASPIAAQQPTALTSGFNVAVPLVQSAAMPEDEEIVILRHEMPGKSKHNNRRCSGKRRNSKLERCM